MGAAVDCELIGSGILGQPVNALTSLTLAVGGMLLVHSRTARWVGIALVAAGLGSFLFHGPLAPGGRWVHDVTLAWLVLVVGATARRWTAPRLLLSIPLLGAMFWAIPESSEPVTVGLFVLALIPLLQEDRTVQTVLPLTLLAGTAVIGRLGSSTRPLCDAASLVQMHGLWHVGAATAVTWWAIGHHRRLDPEGVERGRSRVSPEPS